MQDPFSPSPAVLFGRYLSQEVAHDKSTRAYPSALRARRYGSRALELLRRYYEGDLADVVGNAADSDDEDDEDKDDDVGAARQVNGTGNGARRGEGDAEAKPLQAEVIAPRGGLPPLLVSRLLHDKL